MVAHSIGTDSTIESEMYKEALLKWTPISVREVLDKDYRLEASFYGIDGRQARENLALCKWDIVQVGDVFIEDAFYLDRFKRIYVEEKDGLPFILPSQIKETYPKAKKFISHATSIDIESTRVKKGQVLLTRSGTTGVVSYVTKTLENQCVSDDVIRITSKEFPGYLYTYLGSKTGNLLIKTNNYGAVVKHIEPAHLKRIPIPNPPKSIKRHIHNLIENSFSLRDESNVLLDEALHLLKEALQLPDIVTLLAQAKQFNREFKVLNFSVALSELDNRLDGSYHIPIINLLKKVLKTSAREIVRVGNSRISQKVTLPNRFSRVYVGEGNGIPFFGVKQIYELDPSNKKYLSVSQHGDRISADLRISTNTILISRSGTVGKVTIAPSHWDSRIPNEHIIRIVPANPEIAGYLYTWLSSDYAYPFITRNIYGAVVDEIDDKQVSEIIIPLLRDENTQLEINNIVLRANQKRAEAYYLEQQAVNYLDKEVIYAR